MGMRKVMTIVSIAVMFGTGYAEAIDVQKNGSEITLTGAIEGGTIATAIVVKADKEITDTAWCAAVKESTADESGTVEFTFTMPERFGDNSLTDGEYRVYWKQTGKDMYTDTTFLYASETTRQPVETALLQATSKNALAEVINDADNQFTLKAMGFKMDSYSGCDDKDAILGDVYALGVASVENILENFNSATAVSAIKSADSISEISGVVSGMGFSFNGILYDDIEDSSCLNYIDAYLYNNRQACTDYTALLKQYKYANIFYEINNARFDGIYGVLTSYADSLGIIDDSRYITYLQKVNGSINETLVNNISATNPSTVSVLLTAIDSAIPKTNNNVYGGGGGTSGGSSGGTSNVSGFIQTSPYVNGNTTITFADVPDTHWAAEAIYAMTEKGIISGDGSNMFRVNDNVTREEFVKMIVVAAQLYNENAKCSFTDVDLNSWAYPYIASAVEEKIINGVSETEFGFGRVLTRQDMAVICERVMKTEHEIIRENVVFSDEHLISEYAKDAVNKLYSAALINGVGDGTFAPLETATRAQASQMIYNIFVK